MPVARRGMRLALRLLAGVVLLLPLAGPNADEPRAEDLRQRIEALRAGGDARIGAGSAAARAVIASVYERRDFAPLWSDASRVRSLRAAIDASATHGLDARDFHAGLLAETERAASGDGSARAAERELLLTDAFVRLAYQLHFGKADPRALQHGWNFARTLDGADPSQVLSSLLAANDPAAALDGLAPALPLYGQLRAALARLREAQAHGGWPRVSAGPALERGANGARVAELRERLRASGDLASAADDAGVDPATFDAALEAAVRRFQFRHGLEVDGVAGRATVAALDVPVAQRIDQVRANLERLRWVARELAGDYLLVDIAGYSARLWLDDAPVWSARVVVGKPFRTTPEFRARMAYLVLNPEWNVPPTILREDVLPKLLRDPAYLSKHGMRLFDAAGRSVDAAAVDWDRYRDTPRAFPYQVVQAPGGDNPLGRIKFMFPNEHSVYVHDTPSRALFEKAARAFSSGCIRIERPLELAHLLLDDPVRWSDTQLAQAIAGGRTQTVAVKRTVPVLLLYFTATAAADGEPLFRADLYDRDRPILRALAAPFRFAPLDAPARPAAAGTQRAG